MVTRWFPISPSAAMVWSSIMAVALLTLGCGSESETTEEAEGERTAIGKADLTGSCVDGVADYCGGQSDGNCWCDTMCEDIGDCCTDKGVVCDGDSPESCPDGDVETTATYTDADNGMECSEPQLHCVTRDYSACPLFSPLPPDFCEDGTVVQGPPSYIPATDGMECKIASVHCVTNDFSACPLASPLPFDWCPDGEIVSGDSSFMPSADGLECEMQSVHCVTDDVSACAPEFCADGTVVSVDRFVDGPDDFECVEPELHCLTNDLNDCPMFSPLPPDYCEGGDVVMGPSSFISSTGGKECEIPSAHCVTRDFAACPLWSPLPPDYCADGELVQGEASFFPSTDGMECHQPSIHCVSLSCD